MASIPANVIFIWTGTNATIPSGWSRETTLDAKFAKAWGAENPNITGGADTHTHTSPGHTHTLTAHTHTYTLSTATGQSGSTNDYSSGSNSGFSEGHAHTGTTGSSTNGSLQSTAVTYGSVSNDPPYRKVIFIKASAGAQLATNIVALYNSNTPPSNWTNVTELSGRYMKGASTGADADLSTDNGSSTNVHSISHTHTVNAHSQSSSTSSTPTGTTRRQGDPGAADMISYFHTHTVTINDATDTLTSFTGSLTTAETVEPAYAILQAIKKGASGVKAVGIIGLWLGTAATVPQGWIVCDGTNSTKDLRDKFIKIGDPAGANGGANTHTHAAQSHTHTGSHTHAGSVSAHAGAFQFTGAGFAVARPGVTSEHTLAATDSASTTYSSTNTTADSSANQPSYRTAVYIQFQKEISNGTFLLSMM